MNVLVTGGTGFIGSRFSLRARAEGHAVRVLAQVNTEAEDRNRSELRAAGVEFIEGSVEEAAPVREAACGMELVFHLAAAQHEANVGPEHFRRVNVEGTRNVLEAALAAGVGRVVHGSTIGVYGSASHGELSESTPPSPVNVYGTTKLEGERLALSYGDRIPVVAVRISETYGPGDRRLLKLFR
ncbi:MAG TPA: NAD(P)-dependent oxidoreductase, partial [Chromatiales bacterium]|nr:NAD(P)-dependent oxidoreductase [Chromatiales bacterium]